MLEYAISFMQRLGSVVHFQHCVSKNNMKLIIIKQKTHLRTFHKCYLINSYNTSKRYYYPSITAGETWEGFNSAFVFAYTDTSVLLISITVLCFQGISQLNSLINRVGVNGCTSILSIGNGFWKTMWNFFFLVSKQCSNKMGQRAESTPPPPRRTHHPHNHITTWSDFFICPKMI